MFKNLKVIFTHSHLIPFYLLFLILLCYFVKFSYKKISVINEKTKKLLILIRIIVWAVLILSLINPVIQYNLLKTEKSKIGILIDNSLSMMVKDREGITRFEKSRRLIQNKIFLKLNKKFNLQYFLFDKELIPSDKNNILQTTHPDGHSTDIGNALLKISSSSGHGLNNIILLSDGINNVHHDMNRIASQLKNKNIKIFTLKLNQNENIKDISLHEINHPQEVNVNTKFNLKIKINSIKYNDRPLLIKIFINDKLNRTRAINIKSGMNTISTPLSIKKRGVSKITISAKSLPDESILLNNSKSVFIRTIKSKFKVLLIYGQPSFEYKFLKLALDNDPNIIADTYLKLKNNLIKIKNVTKYDLIIIGNIKYHDIPDGLVNKILYYANNKNGAMLFLGGRYGFRNGDYHNSKLKNIIPVQWKHSGEFTRSDFTLKLTSSGINSQAMHITDDIDKLQEYWNDLPPCNLINNIKKVKKGTDIFALHSKYSELIALAVGKYKRCRIGIFTIYPTWKWGFINIGMGYPQNPFNIFWQQFIRYLISMNVDKINLLTNKLIYKKNEDIFVTLSLFDKNFKPVKRNKILIELLKKGDKEYNYINNFYLYPSATTTGYYKSITSCKEYGEYKLKIKSPPYKAETFFLIKRPEEELYTLEANTKLLKQLSLICGGKFLNPNQIKDIEKLVKGKEIKREIHQEVDLWSNWILLISLIGILTFEWYIRKKNSLP